MIRPSRAARAQQPARTAVASALEVKAGGTAGGARTVPETQALSAATADERESEKMPDAADHENQKDAFQAYREKHGFDEAFDKQVKAEFHKAIGYDRFHGYVVEFIRGRGDSWMNIGQSLGVHRGTWNRWEKWERGEEGGIQPDWHNLFCYLVRIGADRADVFPQVVQTLYHGIQKALLWLAEEMRKRPGCKDDAPLKKSTPPDPLWPCLIRALHRIEWRKLTEAKDKVAALEDMLRPILTEAKVLIPEGGDDLDLARLRRWVGSWYHCWGLFWYAIGMDLEVEE
jgi:hypothetical protein